MFVILGDELLVEANRLERLYYAESSRKTKSVQIRRYESFCTNHGFTGYPLNRDVLRRYIAFLCKELAYSSIQQYLSAILVYSKMLGNPPESRESLGLLWILGGVRRCKGDFVNSSTGILPEDLLKIKKVLVLSDWEDLNFWVACLLMFRTLLRGSNVFGSEMGLKFEDVEWHPWGVVFRIGKTKTIQFKQYELRIPVAEVKGHKLCLVSILKLLVRYSGTSVGRPLLGWYEKHRFKPASYSWFMSKLKGTCARVGLVGKFGTHSFRHGGATTLAMIGVSLSQISKRGDWRSMCVLRYLNRPFGNIVVEEKAWCKKLLDFSV